MRKIPCVLLILAVLLGAWSAWKLNAVSDVLQYAVAAPTADRADAVDALLKARESASTALADCVTATAVSSIGTDSVSTGKNAGNAMIHAIGEGWFEVYPAALASGRRISETELKTGARVVMLDSELAFKLFGTTLPESAKVTIGDAEYRVVGTVRHARGVGESEPYCAYVPLAADKEAGCDVLLFSATPIPASGARKLFETTVSEAWTKDGTCYSIEKEIMRGMMIVRLPAIAFGFAIWGMLLKKMNGFARKRVANFREKLRWSYFKALIGRLVAMAGVFLLGYGALAAAIYGLMRFALAPLYVFTEWVPENFVEWSSLRDVFWNLAGTAANLTRVSTVEMRTVSLWSGFLRWSVVAALVFGSMTIKHEKHPSK